MARPRKQTYTLDMYLKKIQKKKICNDADVQRNFVWKNEHINELIVTVLTDDYIPPIILGEENNSQLHIVDGGCRSAALMKFRYGNYKISSCIENSMIPYQRKVVDDDNNITWEEAVFDIKNKTYDKLPEELREKFDEYQIETVIHEFCDSGKISKYIKRYNNHVSMNTDQKAFTYIDKYAGRIHTILNSRFFVECSDYSESDKIKGAVERIVVESMMCINHFDNWKTQAKASCKYLNDNATEEEFDRFAENLHRLENVITDDIKNIFNKKDSFIFITLFDKFMKLGCEDSKFAEFLREFNKNLRAARRNENNLLFDEIDKDASTKDKQVVTDKLNMLEKMMLDFLQIDKTEICDDIDSFIAKHLDLDIESVHENIDFYEECLTDLADKSIRDGSRLLNKENHISLLAMFVYSFENNVDLKDWLTEYAKKNNTYFTDQDKNFLHMKQDFEQYCKKHRKTA